MLRVIICEDDPIQAVDLADHIAAAGADVCGSFRNSVDARRGAEALKPDLALIDLTLEDGNTGAALALDLAAMGIRIVVLSGRNEVNRELGGIAHTFVAKPLAMEIVSELTGLAAGAR